jgi:hypothetical protein
MNLLKNSDFEQGHWDWQQDMGSHFHIIKSINHTSEFVGRTQVLTRGYRSLTPTICSFSQSIDVLQDHPDLNHEPIFNIVFGARSCIERIYHQQFEWKIQLQIHFAAAPLHPAPPPLLFDADFDGTNHKWQAQSIKATLTGLYPVSKIVVRAKMAMFRGTLLWDDFVLLVNDKEDALAMRHVLTEHPTADKS